MSSPKKRGRPKRTEKCGSIRLHMSTLEKWNRLRAESDHKTHDDFANYLLQMYSEFKDQHQNYSSRGKRNFKPMSDPRSRVWEDSSNPQLSNISNTTTRHVTPKRDKFHQIYRVMQSSPAQTGKIPVPFPDESQISLEETMTADETQFNTASSKSITETFTMIEGDHLPETSFSILQRCNANFSTIAGDPPTIYSDISSDTESSSDEETDSDSDLSDDIDDSIEEGLNPEQIDFLVDELNDIHVASNGSFTLSENSQNLMDIQSESSCLNPLIEASIENNLEEVKTKLKQEFDAMYSEAPEMPFMDDNRYIVSVKKLIELKGDVCNFKVKGGFCLKSLEYEWDVKGCVLILRWSCENKHLGKWESADELCVRHNNKVYVIDMLIAASILFSGNNFSKIKLLFDMCKISIFTESTYYINQKLYCAPVINDFWKTMHQRIIKTLEPYSELCLCGDGRNDSPGHSAKYGVYVLMEQFSSVVVDIEVVDKRETRGVSVNMEKEGLKRLLERLKNRLIINEITTDASTVIQKLISDMKERHEELATVFHSLDVWHKAKNLNKKLNKVASLKGNEVLKPWITPIINHFWHCATSCGNSEERMKSMWSGVIHHICGDHEWIGGSCEHGELSRNDPKEYLEKSKTSTEAVREVIFKKKLMKSLPYYIRNRHTGALENFNGMLTKYTPKRNAFEYEYFIACTQLAAIDHNSHIFRPNAITKDGKIMNHRKYSKRSKNFSCHPVKVAKTYPYVKRLQAQVLLSRINDIETVRRTVPLSDKNPKLLSPTIAMGVQPPNTEELAKEKLSRKK